MSKEAMQAQYEADFSLCGEVEIDELDGFEEDQALQELMAAVDAARFAGA